MTAAPGVALGVALEVALWGAALFWIGAALVWLAAWRSVPPLTRGADAPDGAPRVTAILAARDEAERIAGTVDRLLEQRGVALDVAVADDRSTDATPRILAAARERHGPDRLRVARLDTVPDGWVAKNHALARAAEGAAGDWLLFTDADAWMEERTVADAVAEAERAGAAHLCLIPGDGPASRRGRPALLHFMTQGVGAAWLVHLRAPGAHIGVGAFNLVRREAYEAVGGHAALRAQILDDLELGRALSARGARTRVRDGRTRVRVAWAGGAGGVIRATEKNFFALFGYRTGRALATAAAGLALWALPLVGAALAAGTLVGGLGGAAVAGGAAAAALLLAGAAHLPGALRAGWPLSPIGALATALAAPLAGPPVLAAAILRSTARTLRDGGVRWRDTFYPLAFLRRASRR